VSERVGGVSEAGGILTDILKRHPGGDILKKMELNEVLDSH